MFQWIDTIKDFITSLTSNDRTPQEDVSEIEETNKQICELATNSKSFVIVHGELIVDRKSTFQGHAAVVLSVDEVRLVL